MFRICQSTPLPACARAHWLRLIVRAWSREEPAVLEWEERETSRTCADVMDQSFDCDSLSCSRPWRAFLKEENVNASYANNLCQMFKLPSDHWQINVNPPLIREEVRLKLSAHSFPRTSSIRLKIRLRRSESEWSLGRSNDWCITHSALSFVTKWCSREGCHLQKSPDNDFTPSFFGRH